MILQSDEQEVVGLELRTINKRRVDSHQQANWREQHLERSEKIVIQQILGRWAAFLVLMRAASARVNTTV